MKKFIVMLCLFASLICNNVFADYKGDMWQALAYKRDICFTKLVNTEGVDLQYFTYEKFNDKPVENGSWQSGSIYMKLKLSPIGVYNLYNTILGDSDNIIENQRKMASIVFDSTEISTDNTMAFYKHIHNLELCYRATDTKLYGGETDCYEYFVIEKADKNNKLPLYYCSDFERKPHENFIDTSVGKNNININGTSYEIKLSPVEKDGVVYLPEDGARKICEYFGKDGAVDGFISQKQFIDISGNKYISFEKIIDILGKGKFKVFYDKETGIASACMVDFANSWYMK